MRQLVFCEEFPYLQENTQIKIHVANSTCKFTNVTVEDNSV